MSDASTPPTGWWTQMASSGAAATMLSPSSAVPDGAAPAPAVSAPPPSTTVAYGIAPAPSPTASGGRDRTNGRFTSGNGFGRGNPFSARQARLRTALLEAVSDDDLKAIVQTLIKQAKYGDAASTRLLFEYAIGKPQVVVDPDRVDIDGDGLVREKEPVSMAKHAASSGFRTIA